MTNKDVMVYLSMYGVHGDKGVQGYEKAVFVQKEVSKKAKNG